MTIGRLCFWICLFSMIGWLTSLTGCSEAPAAADCTVPQDWNVGYQDCGVSGCVAGCGVLPPDGTEGHLLSPGCFVDVGTSATVHTLCVESCGECK